MIVTVMDQLSASKLTMWNNTRIWQSLNSVNRERGSFSVFVLYGCVCIFLTHSYSSFWTPCVCLEVFLDPQFQCLSPDLVSSQSFTMSFNLIKTLHLLQSAPVPCNEVPCPLCRRQRSKTALRPLRF